MLYLGQLLRSLLQDPRNFSEVAPEVRPAVRRRRCIWILSVLLFLGRRLPVLILAGAASRRVSTNSGKKRVSHKNQEV